MRRHRELIAVALAPLLAACGTDTFTSADASADGGGGGGDATSDAALDATSADAADGSPVPVQPVACGQKTCASGDTCCVYTTTAGDGGFAVATSCQTQCPAPSGSQHLAELACTSTADCGSNVCCIHRQNGVDVSACEPACLSNNNEVQLCDPQAGDAGCPSSEPCSTNNIADWALPPSFGTCGGQSVP